MRILSPNPKKEKGEMARRLGDLPEGTRLTGYIGLRVIAAAFAPARVHEILGETKRTSERRLDLARTCGPLLRHSLGSFYALVPPGGPAVPSGGYPLVARSRRTR